MASLKRIAFLCEYPTLSGGENSLLSMLDSRALRSSGFEFFAMVPGTGPLAQQFRARNIEVIPFSTQRVDAVATSASRAEIREGLAKEIGRHRIDLLHSNSLSMGRLSGPVVKEASVKGMAHLRDILKLSRRGVDDLNAQDRLLAVSHATRDYHIKQGMETRRCFVLYNGVDLTRFHPPVDLSAKQKQARTLLAKLIGEEAVMPLSDPPFMIITIGQIGMRKGLDLLLQAAEVIRHPSIHYLIVGSRWSDKEESRAYETELKRRANRPPLAGKVHFLGTRDDVPRLLRASSLLIHAARQEPLGRVLLEAAATALPVIATDVGGTAEIFRKCEGNDDQPAARLIPPDDVMKLVDAMRELHAAPDQARAMGRNARRTMESLFAIDPAAEKLLNHYESLLAETG